MQAHGDDTLRHFRALYDLQQLEAPHRPGLIDSKLAIRSQCGNRRCWHKRKGRRPKPTPSAPSGLITMPLMAPLHSPCATCICLVSGADVAPAELRFGETRELLLQVIQPELDESVAQTIFTRRLTQHCLVIVRDKLFDPGDKCSVINGHRRLTTSRPACLASGGLTAARKRSADRSRVDRAARRKRGWHLLHAGPTSRGLQGRP